MSATATPGPSTAIARRPSAILAGKLFRRRVVLAGAIILAIVALSALVAPWLAPYDPTALKVLDRLQSPRPTHWFGTDELGRDVLSRVIFGARYSLMVGALVVAISNLGDGEGFEIAAPLQTLRRRHLVVLGSLREAALDRALTAPVAGFDAALRIASTHRFLEARDRAHRGFRSRGIHVLDCQASELPPMLVNRYLEIKRAGSL